ncbi:MAG TPA: TonB family protein [Polyangia bacterium]|nr:TonB family protein [Polyangia bacterium]
MAREKKRRAPRRNFSGLLITVVIHGAVLGAIAYAQMRGDTPVEVPRDFVMAEMVKLGKPREKFWLPRIVEPPRPQAPPEAIKITEDVNAPKAPVEAPRPENPDTSKNLKNALKRARQLQALAEPEPDEGQLTGSPTGIANEASAGDPYWTSVRDALRRNWNLPTGLVSDAELARLVAEVRVRIAADGTVTDARIAKPSGNSYFDDSCLSAVNATRRVPPPPANFRKMAARGVSMDFAK